MLQRKHLSYRKGRAYFKRRVPQHLRGHPQLPREFVRKALQADPSDEAAVLREHTEVSRQVEDWFDALATANVGVIHRQELIRKAEAMLRCNGLAPGDMMDDPRLSPSDNERKREAVEGKLESMGFFAEQLDWEAKHGRTADNQGDELPEKPSNLKVLDEAWELLRKPELAVKRHTLGEVWGEYEASKTWGERAKAREKKRWDRWLALAGGAHAEISGKGVNKALRDYVAERATEGVAGATVKRELAGVCAALRGYVDRHDLEVTIRKPRVLAEDSEPRAVLDVEPHEELHGKVLELRDSWKKLALLIMVQSSLHSKELMGMRREDFVESHGVTFLRVRAGKTLARKRVVPLVVSVDEIRRLVEVLSDEEWLLPKIRETSESNWSAQLNKELKKLTGNPKVTSYSLRHTWKARANRADLNPFWMDKLGGWASGNLGVGYGIGGDEHRENLEAARNMQERVNEHLIKARVSQ